MSPRRGRWFARVALAAWLALFLFVRLGDPFGDRGMSNVATGLLLVLAGLAAFAAVLAQLPARARLAVAGATLAAFALGAALVRVDGVSGAMIPDFRWRWRTATPADPPPAPIGATGTLAPPAPGDFPAFLGPRRDNAVPDARLARDWTAHPPERLWRAPIGAGWSAFAVAGGLAFTLEQDERAQHVSARSAATGARVWITELEEPFHHALGGAGPRATPAVELAPDGARVYAVGAWGRLKCLAAESGALLWEHDLSSEHGLTRDAEIAAAQYGRSSSPLVAGDLVIVPAGGTAGLVAFDKRTGARRWQSPARNYSYASPAFATLAGVPQVLSVNEATLSGHALDDGRILWEHDWPGTTSADANVSQPVAVPPDRVFVSKGYGGGALLLALGSDGAGGLVPREVWRDRRVLRTKLTNVAVHATDAGAFVYGLDDGILACVALADGAKRWKEGRYGHGQILLAGALLLVVSEEGEVFLLDPDPARPNAVLGSFQGLDGKCWAHLALAENVLYLRNAEECAAWRLP